MRKQGKRKQKRLSTILIVAVLLVGLVVLSYPTVSSWWNSKVQSRAVATYDEAVAALSAEDYTAYFEAAEDYNEALAALGSSTALYSPELVEGYEELLDVTGTGIMGYITIEKIDVELPIYHGTDSSVLAAGAGHLEGSSLPIGGESTHSVISAHRGLASSTLFTHLDQMEVGDTFTITVLNQVVTYEVDQITIVLPTEIENLYIEDGQDYCTLMTCTPYGINTHRLLVRGHRIENAAGSTHVTADADQVQPLIVACFVAIPMLAALLIWLLVSTRKHKKRSQKQEIS
ncbi:MAG: class C sortase [Clostridiales bacterium]|nr:class C sortase [Clostridiales bacterium]